MKGIKSFFTPKGNNKEKDIISIDDNSSNSNENSSSSSNTNITIIDDDNDKSNKKDDINKPIHPLFQKGGTSVKKEATTTSRKSSMDMKTAKVNATTATSTASTTTSSSITNSSRAKRSCSKSDIVINVVDDDDDDDEFEDPFECLDDDDDDVVEEKPKKQLKVKENKDNSTGININILINQSSSSSTTSSSFVITTSSLLIIVTIPSKCPKEFFMSAEEKQRQKDKENEEIEKMKGLEMEIKFKKELKENAKKFEVKGSSNVNSFFMSNTYNNKNKSNSINLVDDDIIVDIVDDYCPYLIPKSVGLPSISDYLERNNDVSNNIVWREKVPDVIEIDKTIDSNCVDLVSLSPKIYVDLNVDIKVSPYHVIEPVGHNDYRNLWSHFLAFNERKAHDDSSFTPVYHDNSPAMFEPQNTSQVIGNRRCVKFFLKWLEYLAGKRRAGKKKRKSRTRRSIDDDDLEEISKVMVVIGPSGSGKTSTVYACAKEVGYKVIEINASQDRSGTGIRKLFSEAAQSHGVGIDTGSSHELNLILFDDADLVFDEDAHMHSAMKDLLKNSKCPVIITTETPLPFLNSIPHEKIILQKLNSPEISIMLKNALTATQLPSPVPNDILSLLGILSNGDSRASLTCVQLMMSALSHQSIQSCTFSSFMDWIHEADVDFARFDNINNLMSSILKKDDIPAYTSDKVREVANVITPIITSSEPRKGLMAGGFLITISGKHFLQHQISNHYKTSNGAMSVSVYMGDILCDSVVMSDTEIVMRAPVAPRPGVYPIVIKITDGLVSDTRVRCVTSDLCGIAGGWILLESKRKLITSHFPVKKTSISSAPSKRGKRKSFSPEEDPIEEFDDDDDDDFVDLPKKAQSNKKRIKKKENKVVESDDDFVDNDIKTNKRTKRIIDDDDVDFESNTVHDNKGAQSSPIEVTVKLNEIEATEEKIYKCMVTVCSRLQKHKLSGPFRFPVSEEEAPGYFDLVTKPMDISTIEQSLSQNLYYSSNEADISGFVDDIKQMWINCKIYNKANSDIVIVADILNDFFEKEMIAAFKALANEDSSIIVTDKSITLREKKVFNVFEDTADTNSDNVEELPVIDNKSIKEALNTAFLSRSQIMHMSMSPTRDAGLEFENEGLVPVHVINQDNCMGCLKALEETWRLRDSLSSAELLATCASNLASNLIEDDDYLDYLDYRTPQQLSITSAEVMKLSSNMLQSSAMAALKDASTNADSNLFLRYLTDDAVTRNADFKLSNENGIEMTNTVGTSEVIAIVDDIDDNCLKKEKSRKSPKIADSDDEEVNFDNDDDDDDDDEEEEEEDDVNVNNSSDDDNSIKCWYDLGKELGNTYIRYSVRKQAYINFVTNILCATETGFCDYSIFKFSKNMKKNSLSPVMALDIIPIVARMLHSEAMHYEEKNLNSRYGDVQRTRRGARNNSKYNYVSNATQLPESTLSSLLEFGFISSPREVGYAGDKPQWM